MESISGTEALSRARQLKFVPGAHFTLLHLTANLSTRQAGRMVKVERCRVRPSLREDTFTLDGDLYFPYEDLDTGEPRMCFKKLIRYIAFPPRYELLRIDWFPHSPSPTL